MKFPFNDLHSFKDYVGFVQTGAPNRFPPRDWAGLDEQWTLERAFEGLRYGLKQAVEEKGNPTIIPQGKSKNQKVSGVSLKVAPATGIFTGSVSGIPVSGVILPRQNIGGGFFLGTNESGRVYLRNAA